MAYTLFTILFLFLLYLPIHSYIVYPISIHFISKVFKNITGNNHEPEISIIISAYNEEKVIEERINNINNLDYNKSKIEVLVGTDCCSDNTLTILNSLKAKFPWLKVYEFKSRSGKAGVINELVKTSTKSILLFTDANTHFNQGAVKKVVGNFTSNDIGGVSGRLILEKPEDKFEKSNEESFYWNYETFIKISEGRCGVLIGANGGIFAIRKELFKPIPTKEAVTDDLFVSLAVLQRNRKFIYEKEAIATEKISKEVSSEFKRKIRFSATNYQTMHFFPDLIFNKNILLSYAYVSHKIIRWLLPIIFLLIIAINIPLANFNLVFKISFWGQLAFYGLGLIGFFLSKTNIRFPFLSLPYFFILTNYALLLGLIKYLKKEHTIIWESTPR